MRDRLRSEGGNALVLMPTAVLIMFALASIAIDTALTFSAQRQLHDIASGIANDAATAIVESQYYSDGTVVIDPQQAAERAAQSLQLRTDRDDLQATCATTVSVDGSSVTVVCRGVADQLFGAMDWIGIGSRDLQVQVEAAPVQG